ncbi:hypothetical protein FRB93_010828 [Tulasnella sp. JGI-2019a]|nr:hypothetical protein FRB93_010828 [Tulasnella sp. JGI-2019a]
MADVSDPDTEHLIADMLVEDLSFLEDQAAAEAIQIAQALVGSLPVVDEDMEQQIDASPASLDLLLVDGDFVVALRSMKNDSIAVADAMYVQSIYSASDAAIIRDYQAALKVAAEERRTNLDHAFALRLQAVRDAGTSDRNIQMMKDADQVLGKEAVESIFAEDPNSKGKGKGKEEETGKGKGKELSLDDNPPHQADFTSNISSGILKCGICHEPFLITKNPYKAAQTPNSSNRISFGQVLPCPGAHGYCIDCMTSYIRTKLEDGGADQIVFPIRCPGCSPLAWQMDDETAESALSPDLLNAWHHQKLLDNLPKFWCPNLRCSELITIENEVEDVRAACPTCHTQLCVPCRTTWHENLTCDEYQQLPVDERMPEDRAVLELARVERWRRCPSCHVIVELTQGCHHITCKCKHEFCHRCGADWKGKCTRKPPCALWEEEMLLDLEERRRLPPGRANPVLLPIEEPAEVPAYRPPVARPAARRTRAYNDDEDENLNWIGTRVTQHQHHFTSNMIHSFSCGYCNANLNSLASLRYHLVNTRKHPLFACCGRLYDRAEEFDNHQMHVGGPHHYIAERR